MSLSTAELAILGSAFTLGLRHGVDYDHIAAISDITGMQDRFRKGMFLSFCYALGHALVVLTLGALAVAISLGVPTWLDGIMGRFVGITLVVLGLLVLRSLFASRGSAVRPMPRGLLMLNMLMAVPKLFSHRHHHKERPLLSQRNYGPFSSLAVGVLHGIGAETPSQLVVFVLAAGFTGATVGVFTVVAFVGGIMVTNTAMSALLALGLGSVLKWPWVYRSVLGTTAAYSLVVGLFFVSGLEAHLPHLL